jgi:hypothetical protein
VAASKRKVFATTQASARWPPEGQFGTTTPLTRLGREGGLDDGELTVVNSNQWSVISRQSCLLPKCSRRQMCEWFSLSCRLSGSG